MKKILLFSRDPGGANTIIPIYQPLIDKGYDVVLYGKDVALKKYEQSSLIGIDILSVIKEINLQEIEKFIKDENPDLIITGTSANDMTEKFLWKVAEKIGIPSIAILDQWMNYGIRFSKYGVDEIKTFENDRKLDYLPEKVFVMDDTAKKEAIKEGIPKDKLIVTGQPYFETIRKQYKNIKNAETIRANMNINKDEFVITFASEPIEDTYKSSDYYGYTEKTVFKDFLSELSDFSESFDKNICLIIKQHPKEKPDNYIDFLKSFKNPQIRLLTDQNTDSFSIIAISDLIVGMSSMFLIESVVLEKKVLSVQTSLKIKNPFILDRLGLLKSITDKNSIKKKIKEFLCDTYDLNSLFKIIPNPVENIIAEVERHI